MEHVLMERPEDGIGVIVLDRPEKLNALNPAMREELLSALAAFAGDPAVRVIVLRGAGRAFCAGNDFSGRSAPRSVSADQARVASGIEEFLTIWNLPKPVIAQVHGHCLGIATILCICCDLVYVADDCAVGWPVLPIGGGLISPAWAWQVGAHKAKEFSFQPGITIDGAEAARLGWANEAVPADQLQERVLTVARAIRRVPAEILRVKKEAINHVFDAMGFQSALRLGASWDALVHAEPEVHVMRERIRSSGVAGARRWYEEGLA